MSMRKTVSQIGISVLLALALLQGPSLYATEGKVSKDVPYIEIGNKSVASPRELRVVVRGPKGLERIWTHDLQSAIQWAPVINFSEHMMLAIFHGTKSIGTSSNVTLLSIRREFDPERIDVIYKISKRSPSDRLSMLPSEVSNHRLWLIPRSDLPVNFIEVKDE